jgi:hypothetical protein
MKYLIRFVIKDFKRTNWVRVGWIFAIAFYGSLFTGAMISAIYETGEPKPAWRLTFNSDSKADFVKITEDTSETLSTGSAKYYYLNDTNVVYLLSKNAYTPVILSEGCYYRYDKDTNAVKEIKDETLVLGLGIEVQVRQK